MIEKIMEMYKETTAKECYRFEVEEGVEPEIMDDKIGGVPYFPIGEEYPMDKNNNPMILLLQINLENVQLENYPQEGILEVFIDKECNWPCDYKIKYFKSGLEYREDIPEFDKDNYIMEKPLKIKLIKDIEHMPLSDYRYTDVMSEIIEKITGTKPDEYYEIEDLFSENGLDMYDELYKLNIFKGNLGGYADFTQTDPRPIEGAEDKIECLFKLDSNIGNGVMIGDCGIIFGFISNEDIKNRNFADAIVDWDCC